MSDKYCGAPPYDRKWIRSLELIISGAIIIYLILLDRIWIQIFPGICLFVLLGTGLSFIVTFIDWLEKMLRFYQTNVIWPTFIATILIIYATSIGLLSLFLEIKARVLPAVIFICVGLLIYGYDLIWELWFLSNTKDMLHYIDFDNSYPPQPSSYVTSYDDREDTCECDVDVAPTYTARGEPQIMETNIDIEPWCPNEECVPSHGGTFHVSNDVVPINLTPKSLQPPSPKRMRKNSDQIRTVSIQTRTLHRTVHK